METLTRLAIALAACSVPFAIMIGFWYIAYRRQERSRRLYLTRLKQERPGATREQFVSWFKQRGMDASVAAAAYDYLQRRCTVSDFPLVPDDELERVCGIVVHEEIDDILHELGYAELQDSEWDVLDWDALGLPPPSEPDAPVASLVHLIDALHAHRNGAPHPPEGTI